MTDIRWGLAARLAGRELRAGLGGFRIFIASLALGVGAIAAVGSVSSAVTGGLAGDARELLGADLQLERVYQPMEAAEREWLTDRGLLVSDAVEIRTMARPQREDAGRPRLVEVRSADDLFPFYGEAEIAPTQTLADGLDKSVGSDGQARWGVLLATGLATLLQIELGDIVRIGEVEYAYRGDLIVEPGRGGSPFALAPRAMV
ncbi:MAG: ABC transporter permease, partial [Pseudomonadota bacterium]